MDQTIKTLIVDDSAFMRCAIGRILAALPRVDVVGYGKTGLEAVEKARELKPDLITLDIEMPEMDGLKALPRLKHVCGAKIIMVSSLTKAGSTATLTALRFGATDFISKDQSQISQDLSGMEADLRAKVQALFPKAPPPAPTPVAPAAPAAAAIPETVDLREVKAIAIGSSTGGPPLLEQIISSLPADFPLPIVVAQHMPAMFTRTMAERLNEVAAVNVLHVEQSLPLRPGHVYVGAGGRHVRFARRMSGAGWVEATDEPADAPYKPSVNEMFRSAAAALGSACLGIVLTGMGEDGLVGARDLHAAGAPILAQDAASCVVYGMPRAVVEAGLTRCQLSPAMLVRMLSRAPQPVA